MPEQDLGGHNAEPTEYEKAQEYFNFFVENACPPDSRGIVTPEALRATVETMILLHAGDLSYTAGSAEPRDQAIAKIRQSRAGMPKTREETKDIIETPEKRFAQAVRRQRGRRAAYSRIDGAREDALRDSRALSQVMTVNDAGQIMPDVNLSRQSLDALFAAGDYLQARQALDAMEWPAKNTNNYKNAQKYWRGLMVAAARCAGPSTMAIVIEDAWHNSGDRLRYYMNQIHEISRTVGGQAVKKALEDEKTAGDRAVPVTEPAPEPQPAEPESSLYTSKIPEPVRRELISRYAPKLARIETQVQQGTPRHLAELRVLGGEGIYDSEDNLIGFIPQDKKPSAQAVVTAETRSRPNPANSPWVRSQAGYDKRPDK